MLKADIALSLCKLSRSTWYKIFVRLIISNKFDSEWHCLLHITQGVLYCIGRAQWPLKNAIVNIANVHPCRKTRCLCGHSYIDAHTNIHALLQREITLDITQLCRNSHISQILYIFHIHYRVINKWWPLMSIINS